MASSPHNRSRVIPDGAQHYAQSLLAQPAPPESPTIQLAVATLGLQRHIEGGYFVETDRDRRRVPNPFQDLPLLANATATDGSATRSASTTIFYLLGRTSPVGHFHRNRARTVHTLHRGRGMYVIIHVDRRDAQGRAPVETFVVGHDLARGERLQWIVEGGKFKASFLLPDAEADTGLGLGSTEGLLISETVVPGFEYADHDFMRADALVEALGPPQRQELKWLLKQEEQSRLDVVAHDV